MKNGEGREGGLVNKKGEREGGIEKRLRKAHSNINIIIIIPPRGILVFVQGCYVGSC